MNGAGRAQVCAAEALRLPPGGRPAGARPRAAGGGRRAAGGGTTPAAPDAALKAAISIGGGGIGRGARRVRRRNDQPGGAR
ncbi:hypothetical protein Sru01_22460 [Sphaerisporangium rufum]|uniref:Uncharacterized protein n=1 Tax=Sphaerisporangium rufum TaxID=1381558 RepID=A0A919UYZ3_9ACTN|nr:hypothetical protein Sru01_22460 [Sphaerisporangium rufum]